MKKFLFVFLLVISGLLSLELSDHQVIAENNVFSYQTEDSTKIDSTYLKDRGFFEDRRNGERYRWIKVGDQIWMAENLRFKTDSGCYAFRRRWRKARKEGYLYTWETAQNVAPEGWHLPTKAEYLELFETLGTLKSSRIVFEKIIENGNFNFENSGFYDSRLNAYLRSPRFWTSSSGLSAREERLYDFFGINFRGECSWVSFSGDKTDAYSVRCIKD